MTIDRQFMEGSSPWPESTRFIYHNPDHDDLDRTASDPTSETFDTEQVVPVRATPLSIYGGEFSFDQSGEVIPEGFWIDPHVQILTGDIPDALSMSPAERTLAEYSGRGSGSKLVSRFFDDPSKFI